MESQTRVVTQNKKQAAAVTSAGNKSKTGHCLQLKDNRPQMLAQKKLIEEMNTTAPVQQKENVADSGEVVQRLGTNVKMIKEKHRYFETSDGSERLRVNPDADAYLEHHFEKDSASKLTNATLGEKFSHALNNVHKKIPYNKQAKIDAFSSNMQPVKGGDARKERGLGVMLHSNSATCWEKAAHLHLVLAELGIPTMLEGGYNKVTGSGHAWLVIPPHKNIFGGKNVVIDGTRGTVSDRATYEEKYDITVAAKQVAKPIKMEKPSEVQKALKEFNTLNSLGGSIKQMVLETIDLKIERALNDKRREKERAEWQEMLDKAFKF